MHQQIYVNLPVRNLERMKAFFASLGFEDLDGHVWELMHMDPNAAAQG